MRRTMTCAAQTLSCPTQAAAQSLSSPDIPRRTHREDPLIPAREKHPFQHAPSLIVKKIFVPFVFHQFRYDPDNAAIGMFLRKVENKLDEGNDHEAVRRRQDVQPGWLLASRLEGLLDILFPVVLKQFRMLVRFHVHGDHFWRKPGSKLDSLAGNTAPAVDGNHRDGMLAQASHIHRILATDRKS